MKSRVCFILAGGLLSGCLVGCESTPLPPPRTESRAAENVAPEMLDRALKGLHSEDVKLQMSGLKFLESFPEVKAQHVARVEELAEGSKDAKVRAQAAKLLK